MKSKSKFLLAILIFSIMPITNVSSDSSSDVMLSKPNELDCLSDSILKCTLPIDSALTHDWSFVAYNSPVPDEFTFRMNIVDLSNTNLVWAGTNTITMAANAVSSVSFQPWNGWVDGSSYNISFSAIRTDDSSDVGNVRYFHATMKEDIDIAILTSSSVPAIKQDLSILGKSYTQYAVDDWSTYLELGWLTHYDKVIMPWQNDNSAKPTSQGGEGYYELIGSSSNQNALKNFMAAGGTLQIHLSSSTEYYEYSSSTGESLLPFDMDIQPRDTQETRITYNNMDVANPYHPIFENVDLAAFQGFDAYGTVAEAIINTKSAPATSIPRACDGYSEEGGFFQRLIQAQADVQDTVLGVCNYHDGGMIVTTIDVESVSDRADSSTFPLLGNMLSYHVSPYPTGFGTLGNGLDLTINGDVPTLDPTTGEYAYRYMKSNAELIFSHITTTGETLETDWEIRGPTDWQGNSMASGSDHTNASNPSTIFCKMDLSSSTGCLQGATWEITLFLHDEYGNARIISVTIQTDDARADEYLPIADVVIDMRLEYIEQIEYMGVKTVSGIDWPQYRLYLDSSGSLTIHFDAGNSSDADALSGNGIESYEWTVLFDKPYNEDNYNLEGHTFITPSSSDGRWAYTFNNLTTSGWWEIESFIRIELIVFDYAGKSSDKYRMYFSVVPEGFGDAEPTIQIDLSMNGTKVDTDTITLRGTILDGAEQGDVYVEAALDDTVFDQTAVAKYTLQLEGKWAKSDALGDTEDFELTLNIEDLFNNETKSKRVYLKIYEGDDKRWPIIYWIEVTLPACQGLEVPVEVLDAEPDAYWIWRDNECEWSGEYIDSDGDGIPDISPDIDGDGVWDGNDAFPHNPGEWNDTDGDGVGDNSDAFPNDANETLDSDMDGVGDNADIFPNDANETIDTDKDGVGDNADAFPEDANETLDTDGDGVGDNSDDFPENAAETKDSDQNGVGDNYQKQLEDEIAANSRNNLILIGSIFCIIAIIVAAVYIVKKKKQVTPKLDLIGDGLLNSQSLPNPTSVVQQWTDDSGNTWRLMDDGKTEWWNGTDWQKV